MTIRSFLVSALLSASVCFGSAAFAADKYGAIAYSPGTGSHGWSFDQSSRQASETTALGNCGKSAGDCIVPIWFKNGCGALAVGSNGYGSGWGTDRGIAERTALKVCQGKTGSCSIRRWACTSR